MLQCIFRSMRDEDGIEALEWIAMGALIVGLILAVYPGTLGDTVNGVMTALQTKLTT
jgi:Flp pilus assembly pilin Flp